MTTRSLIQASAVSPRIRAFAAASAALSLVLLFALGLVRGLGAQEPARVWVNSGSGVYHCAGTQYYGTTKRGEYLPEAEARRRGFRANGGRTCGEPAPQGLLGRLADSAPPDSAAPTPGDSTVACVVSRIADGDTFECVEQGRVRLIGIDAPEQGQGPFGASAAAALAALMPIGDTVHLEFDVARRDRFDRLLAYAWWHGESVNWLLVREGWAVSGRYPPNLRHAFALEAAERRARAELRGLWRLDAFRCRPEQYRRRACTQ
jgi:micrococcal nuclease